MLLAIPEVLSAEQVSQARKILDFAPWVDGTVTAGQQSAQVKDNQQLREGSPEAQRLGMGYLNPAIATVEYRRC